MQVINKQLIAYANMPLEIDQNILLVFGESHCLI